MISVNGKRTVPLNFVKNPGIVSRNGVDIGGIQTDKALYLPGYPYTGTQINDRSGNNNHGTISGSDYIESSVKEQINTATYDAFGTLLKISADSLLYIFTQGTTHDLTAKKKIVGQFYTPSTDTWGVRFDIYDDADADVSPFGNVWGIIGTKIYGFIGR